MDILSEYNIKKPILDEFALDLIKLIKGIIKSEGRSVNSVSYRIKGKDSLQKKITRDEKYKVLSDVTDVVGIRIITQYADEVDEIARCIESQFNIDKINSTDKRKLLDPDRFGYLSLHYIVSFDDVRASLPEYIIYDGLKAEIQIRSILQHGWAEIEHDTGYKSEIATPARVRRQFSRLAGLLELADEIFVNIRESLEAYHNETTDLIDKNEDNDLEIDNVTLASFMKNSKCIEEICEQVKLKLGAKFQREYVPEQSSIKDLNSIGIKTIGELRRELDKLKELTLGRVIQYISMFLQMQRDEKYGILFSEIEWPRSNIILCFAQVAAAVKLGPQELKVHLKKIRPNLDALKVEALGNKILSVISDYDRKNDAHHS